MLLDSVFAIVSPLTIKNQAILIGLPPTATSDEILDELDVRYTATIEPELLRVLTQSISNLAQDQMLLMEDLEELPLPLLVAEAYEFGVNIGGILDRDYILDLLYPAILRNPIPNAVQSLMFELEENLEVNSYLGDY